MNWLRTIYQKLSYRLGFARGLRGRPFALSWWADVTTYAIGHIDGRFKSLVSFELDQRFPAAAGDFGASNRRQILREASSHGKTIS